MSFTTDLLTGLAQYLDDAGTGVTYRTATPYLPDETGVFFGLFPTSPDRCVTLTAYATSDEPKIALSKIRVEVAIRGEVNNSLDVDSIGDAIFNALQGMEHRQFGTAHVVQALRVISAAAGVDDNKRSQRSDSYAFDVNVPATIGRPE